MYRDVAIDAAKKAGEFLLKEFGKFHEYSYHPDWSPSIKVDKESEEIIIKTIKKSFPKHSILSEEAGKEGKSEYTWIIDPLDGTSNYLRGISLFGISITLVFKSNPILAVSHLPTRKELFWAEKDKGAYLNDQKIRVSSIDRLKKTISFFECGRGDDIREKYGKIFAILLPKVGTFKHLGSSVYDYPFIASGQAEVMIDLGSNIWDIVSGVLLVKEAGGAVTDFKGQKWDLNSAETLASNGTKIHEELVNVLSSLSGT